jgi:hypothetical protein
MKRDLILEYLKGKLAYISRVERVCGRTYLTDTRGDTASMFSTYIYRLYKWYSSDKEVFASVFVIMDIMNAEYRLRDQWMIENAINHLRLELSKL